MFSDPKLRPRSVVAGQLVGIGILVLANALAGVAAVAVPSGFASLLGAVPLVLGIAKAVAPVRAREKEDEEATP